MSELVGELQPDYEQQIKQFAYHKQLGTAYMTLARDQQYAAKEIEERLARMITRKPLSKATKTRLIALIENGEIEYIPPNDSTDEVPF